MSIQGDKFTEIADAIRAKKGTSSPIKASDFAAEIATIETGGETLGGEYNIEQIVDGDNCELVVTTADQPENKLPQFIDGSITELTADDLNGATKIRKSAAIYLSSLKSIAIPNSVTSIEEGAFGSCTNLESLTIPDSVTYIGNAGIPSGASKLKNTVGTLIYIKTTTNPYYYLTDTTNTALSSATINSNCRFIGTSAFSGCKYLTNITIPNRVIGIGNSAFSGCIKLTTITIPNNVTYIESSAFYGCSGLTSITIPFVGDGRTYTHFGYIFGASNYSDNGARVPTTLTTVNITGGTEIKPQAFMYWKGLTTINIPDSVTSIGDYAFAGCPKLSSIVIPVNVSSIGKSINYNCQELTTITVADGNTTYHSRGNCLIETATGKLISGCNTSVIPTDGSITSIAEMAFYYQQALTSITIPDSVTSIGKSAFSQSTGLTNVTIGNGVTSIGNYEFENCTGLTDVTIGNGMTNIGSYAFYRCSSLTTITIKATTPPTLTSSNAIPSGVTTIYIPAGTLSAYQSATNWSSFASKFVEMEA